MDTGWSPDPTGRHQQRWREGGTWSNRVRDHGVENTDEGVAGEASAVPPTGLAPRPSRTTGEARFGVIRPSGGAAVPVVPGTPPAGTYRVGDPASHLGPGGGPSVPVVSGVVPAVPAQPSSMVPVVAREVGGARPTPPGHPVSSPVGGGGATAATGASALGLLGANALVSGLVAGVLGGGLGKILSGFLSSPDSLESKADLNAYTGAWVALIGLGLGAVLASWDAITSRAWNRAGSFMVIGGLVGLVSGFVGGYLAQVLYTSMLEDLDPFEDPQGQLILIRAAAWGLFGLLLGGGVSMPFGPRKIVNGLIGGAVGGALGGAAFQKLSSMQGQEESTLQWLGITITGVAIGVGIGIVDRLLRQTWLQVTSGPLAGREIILHRERTTIGSGANSDVVLANDPMIAPAHLVLQQMGTEVWVHPVGTISLDGVPVMMPTRVRAGSSVQLGRSGFVVRQRVAP